MDALGKNMLGFPAEKSLPLNPRQYLLNVYYKLESQHITIYTYFR